jgi:glycosyltransferase involved in cell wall biosynthesis
MNSIDVVIPCYRYGRYLRDCVHSVLDQGVAGLRVLIIDDASPDNTPEVCEELAHSDARVTFRRHAANVGHIGTFNEGVDWTQADCMLLLSADDYLLPGALRRALALMTDEPDMSLCFGRALEIWDNGDTRPSAPVLRVGSQAFDVIDATAFVQLCIEAGANNVVPTPTAIVRTRLLKELGGYRPDLPHSGDFEMWLRLAAHGCVGIVAAQQAVYRRHAANMSSAYHRDGRLADLTQRRAAFEVFRAGCGHLLPGMPALQHALLEKLGAEAVGYASEAFNAERPELSARLRAFAVSAHPAQRYTGAWGRLAAKRLIGTRLSQALLPLVRRTRSAGAEPRG